MEFHVSTGGRSKTPPKPIQASPIVGLFMAMILIGVGIFAGSITASRAANHQAIIDSGVRTEGVITDVYFSLKTVSSTTSKKKSKKITTVSYKAHDGKSYEMTYKERYGGSRHNTDKIIAEEMGKSKIVYYLEDTPEIAVVEGQKQSTNVGYLAGFAFGGFGVFIMLLTILQIITKKQKQSQDI